MKKFIRFLLILFLLIALVVIYARYGGTEGLKTKEYTIETKDIATTFDGIKIVHFSDLHYGSSINSKNIKKVINKINDLMCKFSSAFDKCDEADYYQEKLDCALREAYGDEIRDGFFSFNERYEIVKKFDYNERKWK